jgi:hypothetical protein
VGERLGRGLGLWQDVGVSEDSGYPGAPPGWYADPAGGPGQRWWDGYAWSEAVVLPQQPPPPPWTGAPPPQGPPLEPAPWAAASQRLDAHYTSGLVQSELGVAGVARISLSVPAVAGLLNLVLLRTESSRLLTLGQEFKVIWDEAQRGQPTSTFANETISPWFFLLGLVALAGIIVTLIWQHRAASAARALGFPTTHSPAWGVGSWFVPIINLWFPYQAIRDCLPPDDPNRARILQWWLAYMLGGLVGGAAFIAAFFSSGVAVALSIPAAALWLVVLAFAPRVVTSIVVAHREALAG